MATAPTSPTGGFRIDVSNDRLQVTLVIEPGAKVQAAEVLAALRNLKVKGFDDGLVIEALEQPKDKVRSVVVATGTVAIDERPARLVFRVPLNEGPVGVTKVEAGQLIATMSAFSPGADGKDVFGETIAHLKNPLPFEVGEQLTSAKGSITATSRGNLRLLNRKLSVVPLMEIHGDEPAEIDFAGDVTVKGSLREGLVVKTGGCLIVGGALESADVHAGGSASIKGAIIGKGRGQTTIGGDLWCRFISSATVTVAGNAYVQAEVVRSHLSCGGKLVVSHGPITGGEVSATGGIDCQVLGSPTGVPTLVEAGGDRAQLALVAKMAHEIDGNRKRVASIREKIEPLMKLLKNLTSQQREKVTELMSEAEELEERTDLMAKDLSERCRVMNDNACAEIRVEDAVHAGVTIRFPGVEAVLTTALKGPFVLAPRQSGTNVEVVLKDSQSKSVTALPSRRIETVGRATVAKSAGHRAELAA